MYALSISVFYHAYVPENYNDAYKESGLYIFSHKFIFKLPVMNYKNTTYISLVLKLVVLIMSNIVLNVISNYTYIIKNVWRKV